MQSYQFLTLFTCELKTRWLLIRANQYFLSEVLQNSSLTNLFIIFDLSKAKRSLSDYIEVALLYIFYF